LLCLFIRRCEGHISLSYIGVYISCCCSQPRGSFRRSVQSVACSVFAFMYRYMYKHSKQVFGFSHRIVRLSKVTKYCEKYPAGLRFLANKVADLHFPLFSRPVWVHPDTLPYDRIHILYHPSTVNLPPHFPYPSLHLHPTSAQYLIHCRTKSFNVQGTSR
jgi:hypothetical protein